MRKSIVIFEYVYSVFFIKKRKDKNTKDYLKII
jgi:hypothetical protein